MSLEKSSKPTKLCPTCGTRVSEDSARCLVCGSDLTGGEKPGVAPKVVQGSQMPNITLSLPAVIGLFALFLAIGAILVFFAMRQVEARSALPTRTPTITVTATATITPTPSTPTPTFTPLPSATPSSYKVKLGDTCGAIAFRFNVSIVSIVQQNNLSADCTPLFEGQPLQIPAPTPTLTPQPSATPGAAEQTLAACKTQNYTVQEKDTLSSISLAYAVPIDAIKEYNGLVNDTVRFGQKMTIPLCKQNRVRGATVTPTLPPPYPAPNLLLPADGAAFLQPDDLPTLQWASVGTLRTNEAYAVTIEDVTAGSGKTVQYVADTKLIVPVALRSADPVPHVYRWSVIPVRQVGSDKEGNPLYDPAGAASAPRVFAWVGGPGGGAPQVTPTPGK
jgi:LysM repeat protein